jgi:hypothetical protein
MNFTPQAGFFNIMWEYQIPISRITKTYILCDNPPHTGFPPPPRRHAAASYVNRLPNGEYLLKFMNSNGSFIKMVTVK